MKILFSLFRYLTESILPQLACAYKYDTCHEKDIKLRICQELNLQVPRHPSRSCTSVQDLKAILVRCYEIIEDPASFFVIDNETESTTRP